MKIKMKMKRKRELGLLLIVLLGIFVFQSCKNDDPEIPHEEELITTLKFVLTPMNGGASKTFSFKDLDGEGGNPPVILGDTLSKDTVYRGKMEVWNESETPLVRSSVNGDSSSRPLRRRR